MKATIVRSNRSCSRASAMRPSPSNALWACASENMSGYIRAPRCSKGTLSAQSPRLPPTIDAKAGDEDQAIRTSSKGLPRDTALTRARPGRILLTFLRRHLPHNERAGRDRISNLLELNLALLFTSLPHRLHELINLPSPTLCTGALIVCIFDP